MERSSEQLTQRFIQALRLLEREGTLDELMPLYRDDAEVGNVLEPSSLQGREGARSFWTMYRNTFQAMESSFRSVIVSKDGAALEWGCIATSRHGQQVEYAGVTVLEFREGQIARSWAYFDAAALGAQLRSPELVPFDPGA